MMDKLETVVGTCSLFKLSPHLMCDGVPEGVQPGQVQVLQTLCKPRHNIYGVCK